MTRVPLDGASTGSDAGPWEAAYLRFETPQQEIRKCLRRLQSLGEARWPRDARIVELFCGRGSGLHALAHLGFANIEGVDISARLLARYRGAGRRYCADCRHLPFPDASRDIAVVQGGLHHLERIPADLEGTVRQIHRILRRDGLLVLVEPWLTPFLRLVHTVASLPVARRAWPKLDALATMIEHERRTYEQWLAHPHLVIEILTRYFEPRVMRREWGKLSFVGGKRAIHDGHMP